MRPAAAVFARSTRGATLIELVVGMAVLAILAGGLLRMLTGDLRGAENREAWRTARQAARSGLVVLNSDLRMVETGSGLESVASGGQDLTARVPYSLGVLCSTTGTLSVVSLLPADSAMFARPGYSGFAWRNETTGAYTYVPGGSLTLGVSSSPARQPALRCFPGRGWSG